MDGQSDPDEVTPVRRRPEPAPAPRPPTVRMQTAAPASGGISTGIKIGIGLLLAPFVVGGAMCVGCGLCAGFGAAVGDAPSSSTAVDSTNPTPPHVLSLDGTLTTKSGCFGADNLNAFDHVMRLLHDKDLPAANELISTDRALFMVPGGLRVISTDFSIFHEAAKIRILGKTHEFWIARDPMCLTPDPSRR